MWRRMTACSTCCGRRYRRRLSDVWRGGFGGFGDCCHAPFIAPIHLDYVPAVLSVTSVQYTKGTHNCNLVRGVANVFVLDTLSV